jgi:hypothetical protein
VPAPGELTGAQALASLRGGGDEPSTAAAYLDFGAALLRDLRQSGVLLGSRDAPASRPYRPYPYPVLRPKQAPVSLPIAPRAPYPLFSPLI